MITLVLFESGLALIGVEKIELSVSVGQSRLANKVAVAQNGPSFFLLFHKDIKTMAIEDDHLTTHFGRIWPAHVEALTGLLIQLRQQFDGDLDLMLILGIIGTRAQPARQASAMTYDQFMAGERPTPAGRPINIQSVAECSGMARETVRRKVSKLEQMRLITREANGNLLVTPEATRALTPATEASLRYMAEMRQHFVA